MNINNWEGPLYSSSNILILNRKPSYLIKELVSNKHLWNQVSVVKKDNKQVLMDKLVFFKHIFSAKNPSRFLQNHLCWQIIISFHEKTQKKGKVEEIHERSSSESFP